MKRAFMMKLHFTMRQNFVMQLHFMFDIRVRRYGRAKERLL
jgi:hypothetical protein